MKFFADARTKRNTAFVALLVWLFALASGVANACLPETHEPRAMSAKESEPPTSHGTAESLARLGANAGHHDDSDSTKDSCLKVCDGCTHTLPKAYSGVDHTDLGPPPLVTTLWTGSAPVASAPRLAIPIVGPPFRVCYSRLAL